MSGDSKKTQLAARRSLSNRFVPESAAKNAGPRNISHERACIDYFISRNGVSVPVRLRFLQCGRCRPKRSFLRGRPLCDRLYLFSTGGGGVMETEPVGILELEPGCIYLVPARTSFSLSFRPDTRLTYFNLKVSDLSGRELYGGLKGVQYLHDHVLFDGIVEAYGRNDFEGSLVWQTLVLTAICRMYRPVLELYGADLDMPRLRDILVRIHQSPSMALTVSELAMECGMSRSTLSRKFHAEVGVPIKRYITDVVLAKVSDLLVTTDMSVKRIAYDLGFNDPGYLDRVFRTRFGKTPTEFRAAERETPAVHA